MIGRAVLQAEQPGLHSGADMASADRHREIVDFTISFESHVTELVDDLMRHQMAMIRELAPAEDPAAVEAQRDATAVGVATVLSAIRVPDDMPTRLPPASTRLVRSAVRRGVGLDALRRSYRVAHGVFQEHVFRHAIRMGLPTTTLREITASLFRYYDLVPELVVAAYAREEADVRASIDRGRHVRIERVLAGADDEDLGYDVGGVHIAVVLDPDCRTDVGTRLSAVLGADVLAHTTPTGHGWVWLAARELEVQAVEEHLRGLIGEGHAGVSEREAGTNGFVGAHHKATIALRLGAMRDVRVTPYRDVGLEALAFGGEDIAVDFVRAELGRLADDSRRVSLLRDTLLEYFANSSSTAATARALSIAERTVTYRLRRAEDLLGRPVSERRADLETALRLHGVLDVG